MIIYWYQRMRTYLVQLIYYEEALLSSLAFSFAGCSTRAVYQTEHISAFNKAYF